MKKISLLFALAIVFAFSSCKFVGDLNVEKRHYNKGFYVHVRDDRREEQPIKSVATTTTADQNVVGENSIAPPAEIALTESPVSVSPSQMSAPSSTKVDSKKANTVSNSATTRKNNNTNKQQETVVSQKPEPKPTPSGDVSQIVLVILAIIISPLAVFLKEGATNRFWIDLICWLLGAGVVGFFFYGGGLLLFAVVFALLIVLDII